MQFWRRLRKKVFKRWARHAFFPGFRIHLLRWCGFDIGRDVYIADGLTVVEELADRDNLFIGDRVSIAPGVTLVTSSHPNNSLIRPFAPVGQGPIRIDADAWLGTGAVIMPGVRVGRGAIVGAMSVVTRDVEPLNVVVGQPARPVQVLTPPSGWQ